MSLVRYEVDGAVATITLDRPPVNALNAELIADLDAAIAEAEAPDVRAVVVTGSPHFAAGADITGFQEAFEKGADERQSAGLLSVIGRLEALEKPTIAAVVGFALGGGLELAMGCDFRYLGDGAKVGQPEIRLGLIPGAGGTQRLPRIVGYQRGKELCMSGRHVPADEALAIGLADVVVPDDEVLERAKADAARYAAGPTRAYAAIKRAIRRGYDLPLDEALSVEAEAFGEVFATEDARIGVAAFLAKERPDFVGH
ncbi:MAG TPA: enoyl-CoA hydratase/isomerase family protein [Actinobacteria bacterium]|nr:enoyl-CoA hydratase/isomerase family protein [Actinomycetota bacterium]